MQLLPEGLYSGPAIIGWGDMCHYIIVIIKLSSDLEDEVFFKNGEEDLDKTNDNILLHAVIWRGLPGYFYFDVIRRGLPGFGSNYFFW